MPHHPTAARLIAVEEGGEERYLSLQALSEKVGIRYLPTLEFETPALKESLLHEGEKLLKKGEVSVEQRWFGAYFQKEIEEGAFHPHLLLRWIDPQVGWGVFARKAMKKHEWIAEYSGIVRKRRRGDEKNSYCFEYLVSSTIKSRCLIDAELQGGIARFVNHSAHPNVRAALAMVGPLSHTILVTQEEIPAGAQLSYDYGPLYWKKRGAPETL